MILATGHQSNILLRPCSFWRVFQRLHLPRGFHRSVLRSLLFTRSISHLAPLDIVRPLAYDLYEPLDSAGNGGNRLPPILFLHGLFGSRKNNRGISKALARDLRTRVYVLDLRNHGESPHNDHHDYCSMVEDVLTFVQDHGLDAVTLIGHSMGAKVAMALALHRPDKVASLISVDNAPCHLPLNRDFVHYIRGMQQVQASNVVRQSDADRIMQEFEPSPSIRHFLLGNLYRPEGEKIKRFRIPLDVLARSLGNLGGFPYTIPGETTFEKPTLFIRGTRSNYVCNRTLAVIGLFFPNYCLAEVNAGHWLISEQPEAFRKAVNNFLTSKK
ncbi:hypothetical protein CDD83_6005 [Cordyceps sp. RAO-2017]|nr:hypothetical protein CDD83_6005 [Cordyceps sp. RAO-2017]